MDNLKNLSRALRRHHAVRLKKTRSQYWGFGRRTSSYLDDQMTKRQIGIVSNTPAACSCYMCGNPRKWDNERTIQERRAAQHRTAELLGDI